MTSNNLLKFLGNREYLHQISYQELKSMVIQYPYSLSLRYLLAMKSQQEDNIDLDRNIELLATYGIDRAYLHKIFSEDPIILEDLEESVVLGEDFLELKELSALERSIDETAFVEKEGEINFLEEPLPTQKSEANDLLNIPSETIQPPEITDELVGDSSIDTEPDKTIISHLEPIVEVPAIEEEVAELLGEKAISETELDNQLVEDSTDIENDIPEEEIFEINFDTPLESELAEEEVVVGKATTGTTLEPSESYASQEQEYDNNGLPLDAIEVTDFYPEDQLAEDSVPIVEEVLISKPAPELLEEAVSDSMNFIERPEDILDEESKLVLSSDDITRASNENRNEVETSIIKEEAEEEVIENKSIDLPKPQIPFEVSYSEEDPTTFEAPTIEPTETLQEETSNRVNPEEKPRPTINNNPYQFDTLDRLAEKEDIKEPSSTTLPTPKKVFDSWKSTAKKEHQFSSLTGLNLQTGTGKVIKKKKKVVQKQFEKTVAFAEESLKIDDQIASETLAKLLEEQGHYDQAIIMYRELCLIMPEKSTFFAGEIERIQNLPK